MCWSTSESVVVEHYLEGKSELDSSDYSKMILICGHIWVTYIFDLCNITVLKLQSSGYANMDGTKYLLLKGKCQQ